MSQDSCWYYPRISGQYRSSIIPTSVALPAGNLPGTSPTTQLSSNHLHWQLLQTVVANRPPNQRSEWNVLSDNVTSAKKIYIATFQPTPLFRKIEQKEVDSLRERFAGKQQAKEVIDSRQTKAEAHASNGAGAGVGAGATESGDEDELLKLITAQGDKVRDLKAAKADKSDIENAVKTLLSLKQQYTQLTGKSLDPPKAAKVAKVAKAASTAAKGSSSKKN